MRSKTTATDNQLPETFDELVAALGGTNETARITETTPQQVCQWRSRYGLFPPEHFLTVAAALVKRGYGGAPPSLFKFRAKRAG